MSVVVVVVWIQTTWCDGAAALHTLWSEESMMTTSIVFEKSSRLVFFISPSAPVSDRGLCLYSLVVVTLRHDFLICVCIPKHTLNLDYYYLLRGTAHGPT